MRDLKAAPLKEIQVASRTAAFIDAEVMPHLNLGTQLVSKKRKLVHSIVACLLLADAYRMVVSDSRDTSQAEARLRVAIFDQLIALGFVVTRTGAEWAEKQTRYELSFNMGTWRRKLKLKFNDIVDVTQHPTSQTKKPSEFAPVVVRNAAKKPIPFPRVPAAEMARIKEMECRIMRLNESNLMNHSWIFYRQLEGASRPYPLQPDITVRSLFNQNFYKGGRLYSYNLNGYTHLPIEERRTMLIDGERIAELDFGGFHTRILYHKLGLEAPEDVYVRAEVLDKAVIRMLFETFGNKIGAEKAIKAAMPDNERITELQENHQRWMEELAKAEKARDRVIDLVAEDAITKAQAKTKLAAIDAKEARIQSELEQINEELGVRPSQETIAEVAERAMLALNKRKMNPAKRRAIIKTTLDDFAGMSWQDSRELIEMVFDPMKAVGMFNGKRPGVYISPVEGQEAYKSKQWRFEVYGVAFDGNTCVTDYTSF